MQPDEEKLHFEAFGFLFKRQVLSQDEIGEVISEASDIWEKDRSGRPFAQEGQLVTPFVELSPKLSRLAEDDRIYGTVERLLGPDFVWAGSEGNVAVNEIHRWHADRPGDRQLGYKRVKVNVYLDPVTADSGALRVIPGSHRTPLHTGLHALNAVQSAPGPTPFGVDGPDMPGVPLESSPGDVVFFNQSLYHAMFNGWAGRRYIALKYADTPRTVEDVEALQEYAKRVFDVHDAFRNSQSARIRGMVDRLVEAAPKT